MARTRTLPAWLIFPVVVLGTTASRSQSPKLDVKDLLGQRVVTTRTTPLRDGGKLIERDGLFRVYTVDGARPGQVHIAYAAVGAWVAPSQVVPLDRAVEYFTEQIRKKASDELYNKRGLIHHELKHYDEAIADFDEAIKRSPRYAVGYNNRGLSLQNKGEIDRAIADYDRAIELDPKLAMAFGNRSLCYQIKQEYEKAIADYDRAVVLDPMLAQAFANRALLLSWCPDPTFRDPKRAIESAGTACELTDHKDPVFLNILAGAYASANDFKSAVKWEEKAVELAGDAQKGEFQRRLDQYRSFATSGSDPR